MRQLLLQRFENGLKETLNWNTDVRASVSNDEMRVAPRVYPSEQLALEIRFAGPSDFTLVSETNSVIDSMRQLLVSRNEVLLPMWHLQDSIVSQSWSSGTQTLYFQLSEHTPFVAFDGERVLVTIGKRVYVGVLDYYNYNTRVGEIIFESSTGELPEFDRVVPLRDGVIVKAATHEISKFAPVSKESFSCTLLRTDSRTALNRDLITLNTDSLNQAPILERRIQSTELGLLIDHGTNYINTVAGAPFYVTHWPEAAISFQISDTFERYGSKQKFSYWRSILDYLCGSQNTLWIPTRRNDFELIESLGFGVRFRGRAYYDFWNETNQKALCIDNGSALKVVQVLDCELDVNGNTIAQFSSPVDSWGTVENACLVFLCRLSDASAEFVHGPRRSTISLKVTSVKYPYSPRRLPEPVLDVRADDVDAIVPGSTIALIPNRGSIGGNFDGVPDAQLSTWDGRRSTAFVTNNELRSNLAAASWTWLVDASESFILSFRYECHQSGMPRILFESSSGTPIRLQIEFNGALSWIRRNRSVTSPINTILVNSRYTIQVLCTPSADTLYVNGTVVATAVGAMSGAAFTGTIRISRANVDAKGEIPHILIHRFRPMASQIARIRQELVDLWPDFPSPQKFFSIDFSKNPSLVGNYINLLNVEGSNGGALTPVFERPLTVGVNSLLAIQPNKIGDFSEGKLPNVVFRTRLSTALTFTGQMSSLGGGPSIAIVGKSDPAFQHLRVRISTGGVLGVALFDYSVDGGTTWVTGLMTAPEVEVGSFRITFPEGDYTTSHSWRPLASLSEDESGEGNDLTTYDPILPLPNPNGVGNQLAYAPVGHARLRNDSLSEILSGDVWAAVVAYWGEPWPWGPLAETCVFGDEYDARVFGFDDFGYPFLRSSFQPTATTPLPNHNPYVGIVQWTDTGPNSEIFLQFDVAPFQIQESVDPGPSVNLSKFGFGSTHDGLMLNPSCKFSELFVGKGMLPENIRDSLANLLRWRNGFDYSRVTHRDYLRREHNLKNWSFLHNGSRSYRLSCVLRYDSESFGGQLLQTRNVSTAQRVTVEVTSSGTLRYRINNLSTFIEVSTTFSGPHSGRLVVAEFVFDASTDELTMFVDGVNVDSVSTSSFTFASAETTECEVGLTYGLTLCEFECSSDLNLKYAELLTKWD